MLTSRNVCHTSSAVLGDLAQYLFAPQDYIRAAMTCISIFYQKGAVGYADLFQRMQHLLNAKQHLEMFLDRRHGGGTAGGRVVGGAAKMRATVGSSTGAGSSSSRMMMTPGEVNK